MRLLTFLILLFSGVTLSACSRGSLQASSSAPQLTVVRGSFERQVLLSGELVAADAVALAAPNANIWPMQVRWIAEDGQAIAAGERVVELDNSQLVGNLEELRAQVVEQTNQLASLEARLAAEISQAEFEVSRKRAELDKAALRASLPAGTLAEREMAERDLEQRRAALEMEKAQSQLEARREAAQAEIEIQRIAIAEAQTRVARAEAGIDVLTLRAPRDGILVLAENPREDRPYQTGDNVWPGLVLARLPELSTMIVEARLFDVDDGRITPGMAVEAVLDAFPERPFLGRVREIDAIALEASRRSSRRYFRARIDLETLDTEIMRPGMSVKVVIRQAPIDKVLLVARHSLRWTEQGAAVRRADGAWQAVTLGPCNAAHCVVEEGLEEGARLDLATGKG